MYKATCLLFCMMLLQNISDHCLMKLKRNIRIGHTNWTNGIFCNVPRNVHMVADYYILVKVELPIWETFSSHVSATLLGHFLFLIFLITDTSAKNEKYVIIYLPLTCIKPVYISLVW